MTDISNEAFRRAILQDAYMAAIASMWSQAWAYGYEAARRDICDMDATCDWQSIVDYLYEHSFSDLANRSQRELLDQQKQSERKLIAALGSIGKNLNLGL